MDNLYLVPLKALMAVATAKEENIQGTRVLALEQLRGLAGRAYVSEHMASDAAFMEGLQRVVDTTTLIQATAVVQLLSEIARVLEF